MKYFSLSSLAVLLSIAGLAYGEPAKKSNRTQSKDGRTAPRKVTPKAEKPSVPKDDTDADDSDDTPAKPKSSTAKSATTEKDKTPSPIDGSLTEGPIPSGVKRVAAVSSIEPEELLNFASYAPQVQQVVRNALDLTKLNLTYTFGSADPGEGGMDCSGTVVYLLKGLGMKGVPRQSDEICGWVQDRTLLHRITHADSLKHAEFSFLQPGDLLFWSGTYVTAPRKIPVTHVMLYLGKHKKTGKHIVFGSSDGRAYQGERRTGVSVFDLSMPRVGSTSTFYGYGMIPAVGKIPVKEPAPPELAATSAAPDTTKAAQEKPASASVSASVKEPTSAKAEKKVTEAAPKSEPKSESSPSTTRKGSAKSTSIASAAKTTEARPSKASPRETSSLDEDALVAPNKEQDKAKNTVAAQQEETPATKEEVRRALPPATIADGAPASPAKSNTDTDTDSAAAKGATNTKETAAAKDATSTKKSTASKSSTGERKSKPQTASSKKSPKRPAPPRELTAREKLELGANRFANSVRSAFNN